MKKIIVFSLSAILVLSTVFMAIPAVQAAPAMSPFLGTWEGWNAADGAYLNAVLWKNRTGGINVLGSMWGSNMCLEGILYAKAKGYTSGTYQLPVNVKYSCVVGPRQTAIWHVPNTLIYHPGTDTIEWAPYGMILYRK